MKKERTRKILGAICVLVVIILIIFVLQKCELCTSTDNNKEQPIGIVWDGNKSVAAHTSKTKYIQVPGFNELSFTKNQIEQKVNFHNPAKNNLNENIEISLPNGEIIWSCKGLEPGRGFHNIKINKKLKEGVYKDCRFRATFIHPKTKNQSNGAIIHFTLYVS
jgi:hypothetical protein